MVTAGIREQPFFFCNPQSGVRLFGMLYLPANPTGVGVVFLHPLGVERNTCDTVSVNVARSLASAGVASLRFDYSGTGDSEGDFRDITSSTLFSDVTAAISELKSSIGVDSVGLFGMHFGGMVAGLYAEQEESRIDHLMLCAPVISFSDFVNKALMLSISQQAIMFGKVIADREMMILNLKEGKETRHDGYNLCNIEGFPLTQGLWQSFVDRNLMQDVGSYDRRCLLLDLSVPGKRKDGAVSHLATKYSGDVCYREVPVRYLPWQVNTYLIKSLHELNDSATAWLIQGRA